MPKPAAPSPAKQLNAFLAKYTPEIAASARRCLRKLRSLAPGAVELVYDNYNALVIGFSPTPRPSDAILSLALMPRYICLCFLQTAGSLPDPHQRLRGSGKLARNTILDGADDLDDPAVRDLIRIALSRARVPLNPSQRRQLIIRSISAKQRPRRPT